MADQLKTTIYVSVSGSDENSGLTEKEPLRTPGRALRKCRELQACPPSGSVTVHFASGTYYLSEPLVIDRSVLPASILLEGEEGTVFSGAVPIPCRFVKENDTVWKTRVEGLPPFDGLFVNGKRRILCRYPKYDPKERIFHGYAEDALSPARTKVYAHPEGGFIHAMHEAMWGDQHYRILGKADDGTLLYEGGWQNNRPAKMHPIYRFIENIREEMTMPGEWYRDPEYLYYIPCEKEDISSLRIEGAALRSLVRITGQTEKKDLFCTISQITFTHTHRTFMDPMEPVLRSDWCINRNAAVLIEQADSVWVKDCHFLDLGGNGLTVSGNCIDVHVSGCHFSRIGASAVLIAGRTAAVRDPLFRYEESLPFDRLDKTPGPKNEEYPKHCSVQDCLIENSGEVEKQSAGICLTVCRDIRILHNTIHTVPRAGINICDGTFGGHRIEKNLVFDTVLETGDHGAFNSWGRDRYWHCDYETMEKNLSLLPDFPLLDAGEPVVLRNNIFSCDYGWDIDLDDGASNYLIEGNVCLKGGIKNREGICRRVVNNFMLRNTFHPHVWFSKSRDRFEKNILFSPYADIRLKGWGVSFDHNLLISDDSQGIPAVPLREKSGMDAHSEACPVTYYLDREGRFRVAEDAILKKHGILQPDVDDCGVTDAKLRRLTVSPADLIQEVLAEEKATGEPDRPVGKNEPEDTVFCIKKLSGYEMQSAYGMFMQSGIAVVSCDECSLFYSLGLRLGDVILSVNGIAAEDPVQIHTLLSAPEASSFKIVIWRNQQQLTIHPSLSV